MGANVKQEGGRGREDAFRVAWGDAVGYVFSPGSILLRLYTTHPLNSPFLKETMETFFVPLLLLCRFGGGYKETLKVIL